MRRCWAMVGLLACAAWMHQAGAVTINLYTYFLYEGDCTTPLADGTTVLLIGSTTNATFGALTSSTGAPATAFTDEPDDVVVARLTFDSSTIGVPGAFGGVASFNIGDQDIGAGDPLLLVWYAGLQESGNPSEPGPARPFGSFRDAAWVVPGDNGALVDLLLVTPAASAEFGDPATATEAEGCARFVTTGQANQPPVAQCQLLVNKAADSGCTATATTGDLNNGSFDPDGDPITLTLDPAGPYPLGSNSVALIVTDSQGLSNLCVTTVLVMDTTPPAVTCPNELIVQAAAGATNAVANFDPPPASDNCGIASLTAVPASGSLFPLGTNTVTWTATDTSGNTNACTSTVIVRELTVTNTPPTAMCQAIQRPAGTNCQATVMAADVDSGSVDPDGDPITLILSPGGPFPLGTNAVTLTVADNRGGTNSCQTTVTVVDATPPTISCPEPIVADAPAGTNSVPVTYPAPVASDACGSVTVTSLPASGSTFPVGTNSVTCTAVDAAGNTNTCVFTITVRAGNAGPTMRCQNLVRAAGANCQVAVTAAEVDNGSTDPDGDPFTLSLNPPGPFAIGTNAVTLVGVDNQGHTNTCAASIVVTDQTPPELVDCPTDFTVNAPFGATNALVNYTAPIASDSCSAVTLSCAPPSGALFPLGTNSVLCTAVDAAGNTNTCGFTVIVRSAGAVARDLAVVAIKGPKRVRLSETQATATARVTVTIQNLGATAETIASLDGLVALTAQSLLPTVCPDLAGTLASADDQKKLPVTLKPKQKLKVAFDVTYAVSCIPDLRQTTKGENYDDYQYAATVNRAVLDGDADAVPANDSRLGPITDVVVWFW